MKAAFQRAVQSIKASLLAWEIRAFVELLRALFSFSTVTRLRYATRCYALSQTAFTESIAHCLIKKHLGHGKSIWRGNKIGWGFYGPRLADPKLSRTAIAKAPGPDGEKGVILCHFEYNWLRLLAGIDDFENFDKEWTVVFTTSWSPTDYALLALALANMKGPIYVQPCNYQEIEKLRKFHPRIRALDSLPCDWLHPDYYEPKPWAERDIDILMISNWAPFKRHWDFFRILPNLPADLRIVCVGQPENEHTLEKIRALAKRYQVPQDLEYLQSIPIAEVTKLQCSAKISVIFSLREGCCIAAAESLLAGDILAMRPNAHVGPRAYINDRTGFAFERGREAEQILEALETGAKFDSADWARETIASPVTHAKLNTLLKGEAEAAGERWTVDMFEPVWRPYPKLYRDAEHQSMAPHYDALHESYPEVFAADLIEIGHQ